MAPPNSEQSEESQARQSWWRLRSALTVFGGFARSSQPWLIAQTGDGLSPSYYLMFTACAASSR